MNKSESDTPILDELESETALLHSMAEKVAFWTMVAGHLLQRLEAVDPNSAVSITPRYRNIALGLPLNMGMSEDATGTTYHLYVGSDTASVKDIREVETKRRKDNGIAIELRIGPGRPEPTSGIVGLDGKELPVTGKGPDTKAGGSGVTK